MITPIFSINQDEESVSIQIKAPMARVTDTEMTIDGDVFIFSSKPYYLRLTLPGELEESGSECARYETETNHFHITVPKKCRGEHFTGLEMLSKLLQPKKTDCLKPSVKMPLIEVIEGGDERDKTADETKGLSPADCNDHELDDGDDEEEDWYIDQQLPNETDSDEPNLLSSIANQKYGFGNTREKCLGRLQEGESLLKDVIDLQDADGTAPKERREQRERHEQEQFSEEHYLADLFDDEIRSEIERLMGYEAWWDKAANGSGCDIDYTEDQRLRLINLPMKKEFLLDSTQKRIVLFGLVDLLFAYVYDHRTNEGEPNVESSWTISKLSATLSWFETYETVEKLVTTSIRRSLVYPLYRNYSLAMKCLADVIKILQLGPGHVLKGLISIYDTFSAADSETYYYIFNELYIQDYCVWIQKHLTRQSCDKLAGLLSGCITTDGDENGLSAIRSPMSTSENIDKNNPSQSGESAVEQGDNPRNEQQSYLRGGSGLAMRTSQEVRETSPSTTSRRNHSSVKNLRITKIITKSDIGLDLDILERAAKMAIDEQGETEKLVSDMLASRLSRKDSDDDSEPEGEHSPGWNNRRLVSVVPNK